MGRRTDFHGCRRDVEIRKLHELVIHRRQLFLDMLGRVWKLFLYPCDVEKYTAMRTAAACLHLTIDAACYVVAREKLGRTIRGFITLRVTPALFGVLSGLIFVVVGNVIEHEPFAFAITKNAALAADAFRHQNASNA